LRRATARDARDVLQTLVTTRRTIAYFGPRKTDAIRLPASLAVSRTQAPRAPLRLAPIKTTRIVALDTGANRAVNATIRFPLGHLDPARLALARVFANYLSDNGGVLWDAFRTVRGITFSGGTAWIDEALGPDDDASLMIRFSTSAEQLAKALELALSIAREPKLDREQVELARRRTEEAFRAAWIAPRDLPSTVAYWRAQGNQADPRGPLFDHTLRTNERDLSKLVTTLAPAYITITGDMSAIDRARLQTIGAVETVALPALFAP